MSDEVLSRAVNQMLGHGVWVRNQRMESPTFVAALRGNSAVLQAILAEEDRVPDPLRARLRARVASTTDGWTPLHAAAFCDARVGRALLDAGYPVDAANRYRQQPLHLAARQGNEALCAILLERGASADARDDSDSNAAGVARRHRHSESLVRLLSAAHRKESTKRRGASGKQQGKDGAKGKEDGTAGVGGSGSDAGAGGGGAPADSAKGEGEEDASESEGEGAGERATGTA